MLPSKLSFKLDQINLKLLKLRMPLLKQELCWHWGNEDGDIKQKEQGWVGNRET